MSTFYFKSKVPNKDEFYLRFYEDRILCFKEKEKTITSALDICLMLVKDKLNENTLVTKTWDLDYFINRNIEYFRDDRLVIINNKFKYYNDSKFVYVDINNNDVVVDYNIINISYLAKDSDRHSDKENIDFKVDRDRGLFIHNSNYLLYISNLLFPDYDIKMM